MRGFFTNPSRADDSFIPFKSTSIEKSDVIHKRIDDTSQTVIVEGFEIGSKYIGFIHQYSESPSEIKSGANVIWEINNGSFTYSCTNCVFLEATSNTIVLSKFYNGYGYPIPFAYEFIKM